MMRTFRISLAFALVITFLLVKSHLDSIGSRQREHDHGAAGAPELVLDDGGAHIELVSKGKLPKSPPRSRPSLRAHSSPTHTLKTYPDPTNPAAPRKWEPETVPVYVPGQEFLDDDYFDNAWEEYWSSVNWDTDWEPARASPPKPKVTPKSDRVIVMGRTFWEDPTWLEEELPEWQHAVYVVDDPDAELHVQMNKGKESNIYLQYITDHYDHLPEYMVFLHAHRISTHVEFIEQDNALTVQRLQLDYLKRMGYVNLRCDWGPGCPDEVQPFRQMDGRTTEIAFAGAWIRLFNNTDVPEVVGTPCCAQFAVTREQVLARPLSDYQNYHRWLLETELDDETSGRVFEYLWHIIFGQDPVFCPSKQQCYTDVYGFEFDPSWGWQEEWTVSGLMMLGDRTHRSEDDESLAEDDSSKVNLLSSATDKGTSMADKDFSKL